MSKKISVHKGSIIFFIVSTTVLFFSFAFNGLGAMGNDAFMYNFKDSESLVVNNIKCQGELFGGQLLTKKEGYAGSQDFCTKTSFTAYSSQYGLQGRIYTLTYKALGNLISISPSRYVVMAQIVTALLSAVTLALFALWAWLHIGKIAAYFTVFFISISPMIVGFSRNLYWALPLIFLPLIYVLFLYDKKNRLFRYPVLFWIGLGFLLYVRYLSGYEYITTITVMVAAAISYFLYLEKAALVNYAKYFLIVLFVSVSAFTLALSTHVVSLNSETGSISKSLEIVKERGFDRSSNYDKYLSYAYTGLESTEKEVYRITDVYVHFDKLRGTNSHAIATAVSLFNYSILPVVHIPIMLEEPFSTFAQSLSTLTGLVILVFIFRNKIFGKKKKDIRQVEALLLAFLIGYAGYMSWLVLAHSHSLVHAHINGILFYMPMALFGFIVIGLALEKMIKKVIDKPAGKK